LTAAATAERAAVNAFVVSMRRAMAAMASARPPSATWQQAERMAAAIGDLLEPSGVDESRRLVGQMHEFPGRGQLLVPPLAFEVRSAIESVATVVLDATHLGTNGAAHGGVLPLIFDELMGQMTNLGTRTRARTAYLHVNYRAIAPIGGTLSLRAWLVSEHGRKRMAAATAHYGDRMVADAEGLFVELRPGQP
jgi:acyl-coenzyme A thioesterase PaaI-like protein